MTFWADGADEMKELVLGITGVPPKYEDDPEFKAADKWSDEWQPKGDEKFYDWVITLGLDAAKEKLATFDRLGERAENLVKLFGGGTGLLTIAGLLQAKPESWPVLIAAIPAFALANLSTVFALSACYPYDVPGELDTKEATLWTEELAQHFKDHPPPADQPDPPHISVRVLPVLHRYRVGLDVLVTDRANRITRSVTFAAMAVALLIIPYAYAIYAGKTAGDATSAAAPCDRCVFPSSVEGAEVVVASDSVGEPLDRLALSTPIYSFALPVLSLVDAAGVAAR